MKLTLLVILILSANVCAAQDDKAIIQTQDSLLVVAGQMTFEAVGQAKAAKRSATFYKAVAEIKAIENKWLRGIVMGLVGVIIIIVV